MYDSTGLELVICIAFVFRKWTSMIDSMYILEKPFMLYSKNTISLIHHPLDP